MPFSFLPPSSNIGTSVVVDQGGLCGQEDAMYIISKILVSTDFSDFSAAAVEYASSFALLYGARIHLVHVIEPGAVVGVQSVELNTSALTSEMEANAQEEMRKFVYWKLKNNTNLEQVILHGEPYREIVRYAQENEIDLIVIATHGRTGLAHMLMGSVAEKIVRLSPIPVLAVKPLEMRERILKKEDVEEDLHVLRRD
jgi:nucleotide-binding universal stress UspA family protein